VLRCSAKGLAAGGWPKIACTLAQNGLAPRETGLYGEQTGDGPAPSVEGNVEGNHATGD
jgi:hypothetical protein